MLIVAWLLAVIAAFFALAYLSAAGWLWTAAIAAALAAVWSGQWLPPLALLIIAVVLLLLAIMLNIPALRRKVLSNVVLSAFRKVLPPMSQTERDAIEAGTVWWDGELFSGKPDWSRLLAMPRPRLTAISPHPRDVGQRGNGGPVPRPPSRPALGRVERSAGEVGCLAARPGRRARRCARVAARCRRT